ncbi:MAG: hypothetical protein LBR48_00995 [Dysgonamonadaceae bacterium]|jgi:hypothetical protein|nr:hypothetical protein [Dysgonamonadaceae bacterium]
MKTNASFVCILFLSFLMVFTAKAQEITPKDLNGFAKNDSVPLIEFDAAKLRPIQTKDSELGGFMRPLTNGITPSLLKLQTPLTYNLNYLPARKKSRIEISGYGRDDLINPERTVVFSTNATDRLSLFSANTIGVYKTLMFGNISYYNLNLGANYRFHSSLSGQGGIFYNATVSDPLPIIGTYANFNYRAADNLWFDGGASYRKTLGNSFGINQQSLMIDLHTRYQVEDQWFLNLYGGMPIYQETGGPGKPMIPAMPEKYYGATAEYWFREDMGAEAGLIWMRNMFTGKMEVRPEIKLKFGPKK